MSDIITITDTGTDIEITALHNGSSTAVTHNLPYGDIKSSVSGEFLVLSSKESDSPSDFQTTTSKYADITHAFAGVTDVAGISAKIEALTPGGLAYSTTEKIVGQLPNGKMVYELTVDGTDVVNALGDGAEWVYDMAPLDIQSLLKVDRTNDYTQDGNGNYHTEKLGDDYADHYPGNTSLSTGMTNWGATNCELALLVLRYTKTTD